MMELKPCPFCGSKVKMFDNHNDFMADRKRYYIKCTNDRCALIIAFGCNIRKDLTVKAFNRRVNIDEQ